MVNKRYSSLANTLLPIVGFVLLISAWSLASHFIGNTRMPSPLLVVNRFFESAFFSPEIKFQGAGSNGFFPHIVSTTFRYIVGTTSGMLLALISIFLVSRWKVVYEILVPLVNVLRAIPPLAMAPFLLLWFGTTPLAIIGVAVFYCFVMVFVPGIEALQRVDPVQVNFAKTLGAKETSISAEVLIPSILPALAGPIKIAYNWSWGLVIVGELLGARSGLGRIISAFLALTATDLVVVGIMWILLLAVVSELVVGFTISRALRWAAST